MLYFSMSQYMLAFMVPSMNCSSPVPAALMRPRTMTFPPCLTVGKTHLSLYSSTGCRHQGRIKTALGPEAMTYAGPSHHNNDI